MEFDADDPAALRARAHRCGRQTGRCASPGPVERAHPEMKAGAPRSRIDRATENRLLCKEAGAKGRGGKLTGRLEVFLQHQQGGEPLRGLASEGGDIAVRVVDHFRRQPGRAFQHVDLLFQIGEIVPNLDEMLPRLEPSLHEPGLETALRHKAHAAGRHHPFQVGRDIVAFDRKDVSVGQLVIG